jgi:Ca2+-transporting ATPase
MAPARTQPGRPQGPPVEQPWSLAPGEAARRLETDPDHGLSRAEARRRLKRWGGNQLRAKASRPGWAILLDQFKNLIVALLAGAAVLSVAFGQMTEAAAIAAALFINAAIGFVTELRATRSLEALHRAAQVESKVVRAGQVRTLPARGLVPGDVVVVEAGDVVSADLRLVEANRLRADESALTGESAPVGKSTGALPADTGLSGRENMLFKGTAITQGSGRGVVAATGLYTELGRISELVEEAGEEESPLERRLASLGRRLVWITAAVAALLIAGGLLTGRPLFLVVETAIALAVAAIPEGLPMVATIALARGMWRMARNNAVMNRLEAVETLGAVNVLFTDKTGTLTENRMEVHKLLLPGGDGGQEVEPGQGGEEARQALTVGVLCNNASLGEDEDVGDPMELALLRAGREAGLERPELLRELPEEREEAFDPALKMMATFHAEGRGWLVAVKGAPEAVLEACDRDSRGEPLDEKAKQAWRDSNQRLAGQGLRMLALARRRAASQDEEPYQGLEWLGLVGFWDPPRQGVRQAIAACREAGIRLVMVTGDQAATASQVGREVGLAEGGLEARQGADLGPVDQLSGQRLRELLQAAVFARVTPEQKLDLIALHQQDGSVVAMTGDGVNDAPALKKADIGIAMGRGTQVASEAADMVLTDNALGTIVLAVEQGRAIFANIRRFVVFLLSGNIAEIMVVALALAVGAPLPLLPLQILYLNMIGDVFPALALGMGRGDPSQTKRPLTDPHEPILTTGHWWGMAAWGGLIAVPTLGVFWWALSGLGLEGEPAATLSFLTLAFARLWHVFNMRPAGSGLVDNDVTRNPWVWGALALCAALLLAGVYLPGLGGILDLHHPGPGGWALILGCSLIPLAGGQLAKAVLGRGRRGGRG